MANGNGTGPAEAQSTTRSRGSGLGLLQGLAVTLSTMTKRSVTVQYPHVKPDLPARTRGVIALKEENCTVCYKCSRECPDWCIYIDAHKESHEPAGGGTRAAPRSSTASRSTSRCACTAASASRSARSTRCSGARSSSTPSTTSRRWSTRGAARGVDLHGEAPARARGTRRRGRRRGGGLVTGAGVRLPGRGRDRVVAAIRVVTARTSCTRRCTWSWRCLVGSAYPVGRRGVRRLDPDPDLRRRDRDPVPVRAHAHGAPIGRDTLDNQPRTESAPWWRC